MAGFQFQFLLGNTSARLDWLIVGIFLASLFALSVVNKTLRTNNNEWQKMLEQLQQRSKQVFAQGSRVFQRIGQQVIEQVTSNAQEATSELTEEAIVTAVARAIDVIQTASKEVRARNIPTENVALEVSVTIMGVVQLKIGADVPREEQVREAIAKNSNSPSQEES